jgi:hypothetical protein
MYVRWKMINWKADQDCKAVQDLQDAISAAVNHSGTTIQYLPEELKGNFYIALSAVNNCGRALEFVMDALDLICHDDDSGRKTALKKYFVLTAVRQDGTALEFVRDKELRTDEDIVEAALLQNGMALKYIDTAQLEVGDIKAAVRSHPRALQYVPFDLMESKDFKETILRALEQSVEIFRFVNVRIDDSFLLPIIG